MKRILIIIAIVAVLAVAGYFIYKKMKPSTSDAVSKIAPDASASDKALGVKFLGYLPDDNYRAEILRQYELEKDKRVAGMKFPEAIFTIISFQTGDLDGKGQPSAWALAAQSAVSKIWPELQAWRAQQVLTTVK